MEAIPENLGERLFFEFVGFHGLWPNASLESLSGMLASDPPYATPLIEWVETAWRTPLKDLTCEQVRLHLGQKQGLEWLGRPIIEFLERYPEVRVTHYEGEMVVQALRAAKEFDEATSEEFRRWLNQDFSWLDDLFDWDDDLVLEVHQALATARKLVGDSPCADA